MRAVCLFWLLWGIPFGLLAQRVPLRFDHLTTADGLPENSVLALLQDRQGFVWMGTQNGLARYDGVRMQPFTYNPSDPYSFKGRTIEEIKEDKRGNIWIAGTHGLTCFERSTGHFIDCTPAWFDQKSNRVWFVHPDGAGNIWTITRAKNSYVLDRYDTKKRRWFSYRNDPANPNTLAYNKVYGVHLITFGKAARQFGFCEDKAGRIWVTTSDPSHDDATTLHRYNPERDQFTRIRSRDPKRPFNYITVPVADRSGSLWLPSQRHGLYRINPATLAIEQQYRRGTARHSLMSDTVIQVYTDPVGTDRAGSVWVNTAKGLDQLKPGSGQVTHYPPSAREEVGPVQPFMYPFGESPTGEIWFLGFRTTWRLSQFDPRTGVFRNGVPPPTNQFYSCPLRTTRNNEVVDVNDITALLIDQTRQLWLGTRTLGLFKESRSPYFLHRQHVATSPNSLNSNAVTSVYESRTEPGVWWIGTDKGLDRYDRYRDTFTHFFHNTRQPAWETIEDVNVTKGEVNAVQEDRRGRLWVGTSTTLYQLQPKTGTITYLNRPRSETAGISCNVVRRITRSRDGSLWIGTYNGLNRFYPDTRTFIRYSLADTTYPATVYGYLGRLAATHKPIAALKHPKNRVNESQSFSLVAPTRVAVVSMGDLWSTGSYDYGWLTNQRQQIVWQQTYAASRFAGGWPSQRVQVKVLSLPAGTYNLHFRSNEYQSYGDWPFSPPDHPDWWGIQLLPLNAPEADSLTRLTKQWAYEGLISGFDISGLLEDSHGQLWAGTQWHGLNRLDPKTGHFTHYFDPVKGLYSVSCIAEDRKGRIWVGDYQNGLFRMDPKRGIIRRYTVADGLPINSVMSIQEDAEGQLWLGTYNGLCRFNPETSQFRVFSRRHGLAGEVFWSRTNPFTDSVFVFGGEHGLSILDMNSVRSDTVVPRVVLTDLTIFTQKAAIGPYAPLPTDVSVARQVQLDHNQNDLTFSFAAPFFNRAAEIVYAYQLEGYDNAWIQAGTTRQARYTALPPGQYVFRVKAANPDGLWSRTDTEIAIVIAPPWWASNWAYSLYVLLAAGVIGGFIYVRSAALRRENRLLEEKVALRTNQLQSSLQTLKATQDQLVQREKMASLGELTAGIAHEIQNPLNFVNNFAEVSVELSEELDQSLDEGNVALTKELSADLRLNMQQIVESGKRASNIVRGMLEHSRTGTGERRPIDLNSLANEYLWLAYQGIRSRSRTESTGTTPELARPVQDPFNCKLETHFDSDLPLVWVLPQDISRVLLNLFNNAFYAVSQKQKTAPADYQPTVWVNTAQANGRVEIRVRDNGMGIPDAIKEKIFQPFFTTKPTGEGTGLGLSLSYDIVTKSHGGTLTVESQDRMFTEFVITLPFHS